MVGQLYRPKKIIIALWQILGIFTPIIHRFPVVGHSFNDSDRDGGKIENVLKKRENIYDVEGYIEVIHEAKNKNKSEEWRSVL